MNDAVLISVWYCSDEIVSGKNIAHSNYPHNLFCIAQGVISLTTITRIFHGCYKLVNITSSDMTSLQLKQDVIS